MSEEELLKDLQSNLKKNSERKHGISELHEKLALARIYRFDANLGDSMSLEEFYEYCTGYDFVPVNKMHPDEIPDWVKPLWAEEVFEEYLLKSENGYEYHVTIPREYTSRNGECNYYYKEGGSWLQAPFWSTLKKLGLE